MESWVGASAVRPRGFKCRFRLARFELESLAWAFMSSMAVMCRVWVDHASTQDGFVDPEIMAVSINSGPFVKLVL